MSDSDRGDIGLLSTDDALESAPATNDEFEALLREAARAPARTVASAGASLAAGTTLCDGRLTIVRKLGEGGMGVVYEAFDAHRKQRLALKTLSRLDAANVYRLKNEFRALAEVQHDHLVRLYELFNEQDLWCFTMELVAGEAFDTWVRPRADDRDRTGALDESRLRAALPRLAEAVAAIHAAGKLHRDLKPSNVLVTPEGRVVVLDFGLVVDPEVGGVGHTVADQSVSGTPAYMAPEQAAGDAATTASDLYALGVMLFEALTGRLPFEGRVYELLVDKQRNEAPRASTMATGVAADLDALCTRLLARAPERRADHAALRASLGLGAPDQAIASGSQLRTRPTPRTAQRTEGGVPVSPEARLLGRDQELAALHDAFAATLAGKAVVLFVSGESGMGKSALCDAFGASLRAEGRATVLQGRCYERENVPFKGFDALVDDLSRHLRRLPEREAAALLPREAYALARIFPVLDRVSVVASAPRRDVPDPNDLKRRAFEAFGELMARMRDRAPLVVFLDDVQWLDQDSARFMRSLFVQPQPAPALLICAHRREGSSDHALLRSVHEAAQDNPALHVRKLELGPLGSTALVALAQQLLPGERSTADAQAFAEEARGNPFFALELARAAALVAPNAALPSLAQALALHIASLPSHAQRLLSLLALAGQPLAPQLALDAAGISDEHAHLDRLRDHQLVRVALDADGERSVECYHDKVREHVADALDPLRVKELALGLSRALLAQEGSKPELLARCLELAGMREEAAVHAARAADLAYAALAFDRAATLYSRALDNGSFEPDRAQALRVRKAAALAAAGYGERAGQAYLDAAERAPAELAGELTRQAGEQYLLCGRVERGRTLLGAALRELGLSLPQSLGGALASALFSRARLRLRGLAFTPRTEHDPATVRRLEALRGATHCLLRSDMLRGADFGARWVFQALEAGHAVEAARALAWEVTFASLTDAPASRVEQAYELCKRLCQETGDQMAHAWCEHTFGIHLLTTLGNPEAGLVRAEAALALQAAHPNATTSYDRPWFQTFRSFHLFASGRVRDAGELAQAQLDEALARDDHAVSTALAQLAAAGAIAADRSELAQRLCDETQARLLAIDGSDEVTYQDFVLASFVMLPFAYSGRAHAGWRAQEAFIERVRTSAFSRLVMPGIMATFACGHVADAARQAEDPTERRALMRTAARFARRGLAVKQLGSVAAPAAVLACLRGDRRGAIAALRERLRGTVTPLNAQCARRRLGALLENEEGATLIAEADAFLRAGGVVDPARFVAAVMPGIALP